MGFPDGRSDFELWQIDVFAQAPLTGNPAAVVFGAERADTALMQAIARETNLSETVFLLPPRQGGDAFMRTFTTRREINFAVHPALAAAHAFCEATNPGCTAVRFEHSRGDLRIWRDGPNAPWFATVPQPKFETTVFSPADLAGLFGLSVDDLAPGSPQIVATGVPWLLIELATESAISRAHPDMTAIADLTRSISAVGITLFRPNPRPGISAELRTFAPAEGIYEDPVCGSCAGSVAAALRRRDPAFAAQALHHLEQGHTIHRPGTIMVRLEDTDIHVGGPTLTVMRGHFNREIALCPA
ncbi:PhzF family phenazine biosynthesis protein [Puniceibacterium sediminis]|uniref:Phenazine biosynthesis protein PhzF family n=1 Tax=Puniceibacterium sediminis TaxID=1608407 RepID=A0A238YVJ1_9RHOB|nr:PhzF family phenazine biosynthesis protein [Puniceibacterium sediminis]SNR74593.1 phenazine biosynthesis protein PhzF family [Puniceibacterium sediminis]